MATSVIQEIRYVPRHSLPGDALDGQCEVVGIAWLAGSIASRRGLVQFLRLKLRNAQLGNRWIGKCREFTRLGDAAEEV